MNNEVALVAPIIGSIEIGSDFGYNWSRVEKVTLHVLFLRLSVQDLVVGCRRRTIACVCIHSSISSLFLPANNYFRTLLVSFVSLNIRVTILIGRLQWNF